MGNGVSVVAMETRVRVDSTGSSPPRSTFHANVLTPFGMVGMGGGVPSLQSLCLSLRTPRDGSDGPETGLRQLLTSSGGGAGSSQFAASGEVGAEEEAEEEEEEEEGLGPCSRRISVFLNFT